MRSHQDDEGTIFSSRNPCIGLVFEIGAGPRQISTIYDESDRLLLHKWMRADPVRWEAWGLVTDAMILLGLGPDEPRPPEPLPSNGA